METSRSGAAGGQEHVNKVETKVMLTHIATGIVVVCRSRSAASKVTARRLCKC